MPLKSRKKDLVQGKVMLVEKWEVIFPQIKN